MIVQDSSRCVPTATVIETAERLFEGWLPPSTLATGDQVRSIDNRTMGRYAPDQPNHCDSLAPTFPTLRQERRHGSIAPSIGSSHRGCGVASRSACVARRPNSGGTNV